MSKIEKIKAAKDGLDVLPDLLRAAEQGYEALSDDDAGLLKWYGLYQHKRAYGGRWLELTGAHERVFDPRGYVLGRLAGRAAGILRR